MIVFLILHYLALEDTIECIESIKNTQLDKNYKIIVVDNGSTNNSYSMLLKRYESDSDVRILFSEKNVGFSRGNNLGFVYAKKNYQPDFIVMINNDTVIEQKDFCNIIVEKYKKYNFSVLGPDIVTADGIHQNPWIRNDFSKLSLKLFRLKQFIRIILSYLRIDSYIYKYFHRSDKRKVLLKGDYLDVPLHGAALIFSRNYINYFDGLDAITFLYFEEEILRYHCQKRGLLMMYSSDLRIYHKEDVSTKMFAKKSGEKERFEFKNRIIASKKYEKLIGK